MSVIVNPSPVTGGVLLTVEGGLAIQLINNTGAPSVKGTVVSAATAIDNGFKITPADGASPIGVVYEAGIANGALCWVVISGRCQVLLEDGVGSVHGNWVRTSIGAAGRADATNAGPPGGGVVELDRHMTEIGHCLETIAGGGQQPTLCFMLLHFN